MLTALHRGRCAMVWQTQITRNDGRLAALVIRRRSLSQRKKADGQSFNETRRETKSAIVSGRRQATLAEVPLQRQAGPELRRFLIHLPLALKARDGKAEAR